MKKVFFLFLTATLFLSILFAFQKVQAGPGVSASSEEAVINFFSTISVNLDNSVDVVENVRYDTGPLERHGIYRDIYPYSSQKRKMAINNVSVYDENGAPQPFEVGNSGANVRIKIGDPDKTFAGQRTYIIKYHATKAVAQLKDLDEIYWNVTGNEWNIPIYQTQADIVLPSGIRMLQSACYSGPKGSPANNCQLSKSENESYVFEAIGPLNAQEGLTVAIGFPKGIVIPYSASDSVYNFFSIYRRWIISAIFPLLTLILTLLYWYKKGRDPKGKGVIVPQYDVPDGLTPIEVCGIINQKVRSKDISPEIIYLATKGYLKIQQTEKEHVLGIFHSKEYELTNLKDPSDLSNEFDRTLFWSLFGRNLIDQSSKTIKLSELKNKFYKNIKPISTSVMDSLLDKGYYKNIGGRKISTKHKNSSIRVILYIILYIFARAFLGIFFESQFFSDNIGPIITGALMSLIVYEIISHFFPAKTEKGVATKEYLLGLKDYLQIAEKDRLEFHNAPEKKPEVFEKLLPYAMALGVADIWAKEFEGIYLTPPAWYSSSSSSAFGAVTFSHAMANFSSFSNSKLGTAPGGVGGSGGGGSSGGGGGGGGGGGW